MLYFFREETEIYLTHVEEDEEEALDEDDIEEKKELESFQEFLSKQKVKRDTQKMQQPNS